MQAYLYVWKSSWRKQCTWAKKRLISPGLRKEVRPCCSDISLDGFHCLHSVSVSCVPQTGGSHKTNPVDPSCLQRWAYRVGSYWREQMATTLMRAIETAGLAKRQQIKQTDPILSRPKPIRSVCLSTRLWIANDSRVCHENVSKTYFELLGGRHCAQKQGDPSALCYGCYVEKSRFCSKTFSFLPWRKCAYTTNLSAGLYFLDSVTDLS